MPTQPLFDDPSANLEYAARTQLKLGDEWRLESSASAISVGIEEQIDRLEADEELDDGARWRGLNTTDAPIAWLPKGLFLITMRKEADNGIAQESGFVRLEAESDALEVLRKAATGETAHIYNGLCPDSLEGHNYRDPECEVCRALVATESKR